MKKLLLLIIIFTVPLIAQNSKKYERLILLSESLSYNFEFDSAKSVIYTAIKIHPQSPEAYLSLAKIHLWFYLGSKEEKDYNLFINFSDSCQSRINVIDEKHYRPQDLLYLNGNVQKYKAMAYGTKGNTLDAFWATKKSVSYFEEVLEIDPNYFAAYGGIGIFEYALSYVPAFFNWALTISGLSADQKNGFDFLQLAVKKGKVDNTEYKFHFAKLLDEHLAEYDNSIKLLNELTNKFPNNSLFHYQKAIEYIKSHQLNNAIKEIEIVQEINHSKFSQTNSFSNFLLGDIYFRLGKFKLALEYYLKFLTSTKSIDYTGIASFRTAFCYYFLDNESEFKRYLLLAPNGNLDLEDDKYAKDISLKLLENRKTNEYKTLLEIENKFLSGNYNECLIHADSSLESLKWNNVKAQILVYKGLIFAKKENRRKIGSVINELDSLNLDFESWVLPMTYYLKAVNSVFDKKFDLAKEFIGEAESTNEYHKKYLISSYINKLKKDLLKLSKS